MNDFGLQIRCLHCMRILRGWKPVQIASPFLVLRTNSRLEFLSLWMFSYTHSEYRYAAHACCSRTGSKWRICHCRRVQSVELLLPDGAHWPQYRHNDLQNICKSLKIYPNGVNHSKSKLVNLQHYFTLQHVIKSYERSIQFTNLLSSKANASILGELFNILFTFT